MVSFEQKWKPSSVKSKLVSKTVNKRLRQLIENIDV